MNRPTILPDLDALGMSTYFNPTSTALAVPSDPQDEPHEPISMVTACSRTLRP